MKKKLGQLKKKKKRCLDNEIFKRTEKSVDVWPNINVKVEKKKKKKK